MWVRLPPSAPSNHKARRRLPNRQPVLPPGARRSGTLVGTLAAICISLRKGTPKSSVPEAELVVGYGLQGDAHAGAWHRQVSLLADEDVETMRQAGLEVEPGAFGENLLTRGIDLTLATVGSTIRVGSSVLLEVTQRGKECHSPCAIGRRMGTCIMPQRGIFARVLEGGKVRVGDRVEYETVVV